LPQRHRQGRAPSISTAPLRAGRSREFPALGASSSAPTPARCRPRKSRARPPANSPPSSRRSATLTADERATLRAFEGRAGVRRLNGYEYENALRDLLSAPWLQVRGQFPEDGEAHRFNKIGDALDVSHVHLARYLAAADYAIRQALSVHSELPPRPHASLRPRPAHAHQQVHRQHLQPPPIA
jgi:hypothetical protein